MKLKTQYGKIGSSSFKPTIDIDFKNKLCSYIIKQKLRPFWILIAVTPFERHVYNIIWEEMFLFYSY